MHGVMKSRHNEAKSLAGKGDFAKCMEGATLTRDFTIKRKEFS